MKTSFREKLKKDIILLDGAFGTYAQSLGLKDEYFKDKPGCMEYLSLVKPHFVAKVHQDYLDAGSNAIETNTFGGNSLKLAEYGLEGEVYQINRSSTALARRIADDFSSSTDPRFVVGSIGPTGKLPSSMDPELGNISYDDLKEAFYDQVLGIIDGGADALIIETGQDLLEMKAAVNAAKEAIKERRKNLVIISQCTLANNGRMLLGTDIMAVMATMGYLGTDVIGINCSTGPVEMESALKILSKKSPSYVSLVPNAGLPIKEGSQTIYPMKPGEMADIMASFIKKYRIDVIGGCCGTTPDHIKAIKKVLKGYKKEKVPKNFLYASSYNGFDLKKEKRPIKVGERINTQGSRKIKELLKENKYDEIIEIGKAQLTSGAQILDVCTVLTERATEEADMLILTRRLAESVEVPLMVDSTSASVVEAAVEKYPGTAFINSVNLEDGGVKARKIFRLAKEHGSFIVNLVIDEKGMAKTVAEKVRTAERLYDIATGEFGIEPQRLIFDMLTFSLGTGEREYAKSATTTYEAIWEFKESHPDVLMVLGVSNVSFGLPKAARKVLNMVYLHHASVNGLDMAIVNPLEYMKYKDISKKEIKLAEDLIFDKKKEALGKLIEHFSGKEEKTKKEKERPEKDLSCEEKIKKCIFDRDKTSIIASLDEALKKYSAQDIINKILMPVMREVGQKLDKGEIVLPYVLQSAEVMRASIEYLEKFLKTKDKKGRAKVLLATVAGDVHDIGKNLVKMILQNNGFKVIDLGKQVPVSRIIKEAKKNKVDAVGLSALLVSTACHMKTCVQSMHDAGLDYPVLIGGAPVNDAFAKEVSELSDKGIYSGGVFYCKDAFTGLQVMQSLTNSSKKKSTMEKYKKQFKKTKTKEPKKEKNIKTRTALKKSKKLKPPFYGVRTLTNIPADDVFKYLDERMLFNFAWGAKIKDEKKIKKIIKEEYQPLLKELKVEAIKNGWLNLKAVYGYFDCKVQGTKMQVISPEGKALAAFVFPEAGTRSLADYFSASDIAVFQVVTVGVGISRAVDELNKKKEFSRAFCLHGLGVQMAEALAAYMHDKIRKELKLKKNQGKRYSPGYPLWKDIKDQLKLFKLLDVKKRLKLELTEAFQMVPEASTSAMIVCNEKAEY